jgi:hypothetical protein
VNREQFIDLLAAYSITARRHQVDVNEVNICCPFCLEQGELTEDKSFRLGINITAGYAHCFNCDWSWSRHTPGMTDAIFQALGVEAPDYPLSDEDEKPVVEPKKKKHVWQEIGLPEGFERVKKTTRENDFWAYRAWRYLKDRGITEPQLKTKNIGYTLVGDYAYRVIFPVYYGEKLLGLVGRDFTGKRKPKYLNSTNQKAIYNLPKEKTNSKVVLVEGAFDTLAVERGLPRTGFDVGGVLGHSLTDAQLRQLRGYQEFVLWPDPDGPGVKGFLKMAAQLEDEGYSLRMVCPDLTGKKEEYDPSDLRGDEVMWKVRKAQPYSPDLRAKLESWLVWKE